jgi:signal transduction histidine kinase
MVFASGAIASSVALITLGVWNAQDTLAHYGWSLIAWAAVVALVGVASVSSDAGPQLGLDMPLLLAAGFLFGPGLGGAIAFAAYVDLREFRGEISLVRALYNRAQTSLSVMFASVIFTVAGGQVGVWPAALLASSLAVAADCFANYSLVTAVKSLHDRDSPRAIVAGLHLGPPLAFVLTYLSYGLLSLILAEIYVELGVWGLGAFAIPVLLARQAFEQSRRVEAADSRLRASSAALRDVSSRVADERRDERLAVAADLHDEVLPSLYNVHLMGQVLRQDLAAGRLLQLDSDIPELLRAADSANEVVRGLIRGLRESPLGAAGFARTLELLVGHMESLASARFELDVEDIQGPPLTQLLAYQVIREALTNAVRYANASLIRVHVGIHGGCIRLVVRDDGLGFVPSNVDHRSHFGLQLMRERVELIGGVLHVSAELGRGTQVVARLPMELGGPETQD